MTNTHDMVQSDFGSVSARPVLGPAGVLAARAFLEDAWGGGWFPCVTGPDEDLRAGEPVQPESFTAMLVADALGPWPAFRPLVSAVAAALAAELGGDDRFYFFRDHARLPADADCTAVGLSVLLRSAAPPVLQAHRALDRMRANVDGEGRVLTYFDAAGERATVVDAVVAANVLYLAHRLGRHDEFAATEAWVCRALEGGEYLGGTRYYPSPDTFLYFVARAVAAFPRSRLAGRLRAPARAALEGCRAPAPGPLGLSQRVRARAWLGLPCGAEAAGLARQQAGDGSWRAEGLFRYGRAKVYFGSASLSTAFAAAALCASGAADAGPSAESRRPRSASSLE